MRSTWRSWFTLLACVATAGGVHAQAQGTSDPAAGPGPAGEPQAADAAWRLPPLRLSGSLAYDMRATRAQQGSNLAHLVTATVSAHSFIYQPWFAQVGGSLGLTTGLSRSSAAIVTFAVDGTDAATHERIRVRDRFLTGNIRLELFPLSRFPFAAQVESNDSRVDSGLASPLGFRTRGIRLTQRYRPANGAYSLSGSYDHREQSSQLYLGKQDALAGEFNTNWKANELSVGAALSRAGTVGSDDDSRYASLVARHSYTPSSALSVNSTVNWTHTEEGAAGFASDIAVLQGSSVGIWRREGSPLTLSANARAMSLRERVSGNALDSLGLTLGASYELTPNLRVSASGGASFNRSDGRDSTALTGSVAASYQGPGLEIAGVRYDWFSGASAGASLAQGSDNGSHQQQTLSLQAGHSLSRSFRLGAQSQLSFNASQSLAWSRSRSNPEFEGEAGLGSSRMLLHTLGSTWQMGSGAQTMYVRASYNDSKELGGGHARFRLFNVQLSGNLEFGNRRSLIGNLTYQRSLQDPGSLFRATDLSLAGGRSGSAGASGEITYSHMRPFGVPGLRFVSRLRLAQDVLKQPGTLLSLPDRETRMWENRLDWSVGRLETQLVLRLSEVDNVRVDSLTLRVQRSFGE